MTNFEEIFTTEERELIAKCIEQQMYDSIPSALESYGFGSMTPEKERVLEIHLNKHRPVSEDESAVKNELQQMEMKGYKIETPEQEKEWQVKFDAEREARATARQKVLGEMESATETKTTIGTLTNENEKGDLKPLADDPNEIVLTKVEVMQELASRGISFKPQASKASLVALLENAKQPA